MFTKKNFKKLLLAGAVLAGLQSVGALAMNKKPALAHQINDVFVRKNFDEIEKFMKPAGSMLWKTEAGRNPLHVAAYLGLSETIIKFLIEKANLTVGFDFDAVDEGGLTAIELAVDQEHHAAAKQIIKALFMLKPNRLYDSNFCTVIDLIAIHGYLDVANFVAEYAKNNPSKFDLKKCINRFNPRYCKLPLELAIKFNKPDVAKWLIEHGSVLERTDVDTFDTKMISFEDLAWEKVEANECFIEVASLIASKMPKIKIPETTTLQEPEKKLTVPETGSESPKVEQNLEKFVPIRSLFQIIEPTTPKPVGENELKSKNIEQNKNIDLVKLVTTNSSWTSSIARIFSMASTIFLGNIVGDMFAKKQFSKPLLVGGISAFLLTHVAELVTKDKKTGYREHIKNTWLGKTVGFGLGVAVPVACKKIERTV